MRLDLRSARGHPGPYTLPLSGQQTVPSPGTRQPQVSTLASRLPSATSVPSSSTACLRLTHTTSLQYSSVLSSAHHTLTTPPLSFPRPAKPPLLRVILNSCSCLLLVRSVVVWGPMDVGGLILSYERANGN
jgi:hypothetical protein